MISKIAVKRPVTMIMVLIAILSLGGMSMATLPQALMPNIEFPIAMTMVTYPGASPEEVNDLVTKPLEQSMASVENLKNMYSYSMENTAVVLVEFNMGTDMDVATLDMREKASRAQMSFPDDASSPTVLKANMNSMPVMSIYAYSDMELTEMAEFIDDNITSKLEKVPGVASVNIAGAQEDEVNIAFDQDKLSGYGLSLSTVSSMLSAENINMPSGNVTSGATEMIVRTNGEFEDVAQISQVPITLKDGSVILLQDVATVTEGPSEKESVSRLNGNTAISMSITKSSDGNVVEISDDIQKVMAEIEEEYGDKIHFSIGYDTSKFVRKSISSVAKTALQGAFLAVIIIFLFLRNVRSTMVIGLSIPASVLATFATMKLMDMSLNMITLGSLTLAIGMVVDNSVVVLENIFRHNRKGLDSEQASIVGSREVILAVAASTLTSVVVFLPIALADGYAGMIFRDFCMVIIIALAMSLLVSVTVVPMLCSRLLDNSVSEDYLRVGKFFYRYKLIPHFSNLIHSMQKGYLTVIGWMLRRRKRVIAMFTALFVGSIGLVAMVGSENMPSVDQGQFSVSIELPYGTTLEDKDAFITPIEKYLIEEIDEVDSVALSIGSTSAFSTSEASTLTVTLVDKSDRNRSTGEIMAEAKEHFKDLSGADITWEETSSMGGGSSMSGSGDLTLNVGGEDVDQVGETTEALAAAIKENVKGISEITDDVEEGTPEVVVSLNRGVASNYGVTSYQLGSALSEALSGKKSTTVTIDGDEIDVNLKLSDEYGESIENMKSIMVKTSTGTEVPVGQIADFTYGNSALTIFKDNQSVTNMIDITFDENVDITKGTERVMNFVNDKYTLPEGITVDSGGEVEDMQESFGSLYLALMVALLLVYVVLASQFESFILPIMIMMSIPFAMSGSFMILYLTGTKLSMVSIIGMIMLVGMVVNNAILLIEFINQNKDEMSRDKAIAQAGSVRLRPILMTTLTTVIGMMPMALGIGEGSEMMAPMAITIIGGLTASTVITLFFVPLLYAMVDDLEVKISMRRSAMKRRNIYLEAKWLAKGAEERELKRRKKEGKK
ncbi:MAG: efflux RND transporter permease subunit [Clostridia bacterium]|nr:efflux RND transporter permease subunit [Clostridia bacterium]